MLKKLIINFVLMTVVSVLVASHAGAVNHYIDVKSDSWYGLYVNELTAKKIIDGFPDGSFKPDDTLSGAQFIKMVVTALGHKPGNGTAYWASSYINYAVDKGLLDNSTIIDFEKPLPRGEIACIVSGAISILNIENDIKFCGLYDLYGYTPVEYIPYVLQVYNAGIMIGYPDRTFRYNSYISRAEACAVIHKLVTPIIRREQQITSLTPVPVCYSYINEEFQNTINNYEGCKGIRIADGLISGQDNGLDTEFNSDINQNITESMKLMLDNITWPVFEYIALAHNNVAALSCFFEKKFSSNNMYSMFTVKFYDAPTGYPEKQWGYDSMFIKLEINRLSDDGLLNRESGLPDIYYEYKIKSMMRLLFGKEKGDVFSLYILNKYIQYAKYSIDEIAPFSEALILDGTKMIFFSEGINRQLCFTFSED